MVVAEVFSVCLWVVLLPVLVLAVIWAIWAALKPPTPSAGGGHVVPTDRTFGPVEDEAETFFASEGLIFEDEQME